MKLHNLIVALVALCGFVVAGCSAPADEEASTPVPEGQGTGKFKASAEASGGGAPTGNAAEASPFRSSK